MANKRMNKTEFVTNLAEKSGLTKDQTKSALDAFNEMIIQQLGKNGPGEVLIPGLLRLKVVDKPATPKHEGINPFTKEPMTYNAKPAHKAIKVMILKTLKNSV
jgi:nucleoid DNA-binding protein